MIKASFFVGEIAGAARARGRKGMGGRNFFNRERREKN
jgi:hypothetical protein